MKTLFLADLANFNEESVIEHLRDEYTGGSEVDKYSVLIAYESVGDWGCDSSSFFLLKNKETGKLFEVHGGHCSCYGFEGQFTPEETTMDYLTSEHFYFSHGGYDDAGKYHDDVVKEFINEYNNTAV